MWVIRVAGILLISCVWYQGQYGIVQGSIAPMEQMSLYLFIATLYMTNLDKGSHYECLIFVFVHSTCLLIYSNSFVYLGKSWELGI